MEVEKLIEEIRNFPVLYDQTNENYRNNLFKENIWRLISSNLQAKGGIEECKQKWNSVRDQLRWTLQKRKSTSGQEAQTICKYKYENHLEFLKPHLNERETLSNIDDVEEENCTELREDTSSSVFSCEDENTEQQASIPGTSKEFKSPVITNRAKKRKNEHLEESLASKLMSFILEEKKKEVHPVDTFLNGIAPTLKSLHPVLLNKAKSAIFKIVQDYELQQLELQEADKNKIYF